MRKTFVLSVALIVFLVLALYGVQPKKWVIQNLDEFIKGKLDGISVSYEGILSLSLKEDVLEGPPEEFFLSFLQAPDGTAFLGTGHGGKIFRIDRNGQIELYFDVPEMDIYCLARDARGNLYAGSSPNGKIYRIMGKNDGVPLFNPQEKYIWDLMFTEGGALLAAVGESGGIYEINSQGEGALILKADENHILCMARTQDGDLLAGSGGKGHLYRISRNRKAFILFESPYEEIKSIALDESGNIYAAAGGKVTRPKLDKISPVPAVPATDVTITVTPPQEGAPVGGALVSDQPSSLYRISPEGIAKRLWHSEEDLIYTILWDNARKRVLFGTGNRGRIFAVDAQENISLLLQKRSEQVYSLIPSGSKIYALSNNPSSLSDFQPDQRFEGEYTSRVFDSKLLSSWGKIRWEADMPQGSTLQFLTRSGNTSEPNKTWSDWSPPYQNSEGEQILNPKARYIQFKAIFKTQSGRVSPKVSRITLFYLQSNIPPVFSKIELLPTNEVYIKPPEQEEVVWGKDVDISTLAQNKDDMQSFVIPKKAWRKGHQTVLWNAVDENGDMLLYSVFIKKEEEVKWTELKTDWTENIFTFDTISFPDGIYSIKIEASDRPSNPAGQYLIASKVSRPLVIDNSLPTVLNLKADRNTDRLSLSFTAQDSFSYIKKVQFLIRPDEWKLLFPVDGICDSKIENFEAELDLPANSDNLISIKVEDSRGNIKVFRQSF
jgi:hypothetical protein